MIGSINEKVLKEFEKAGIEIPYPKSHVLFESIEKEIPKKKAEKKVSKKTKKKKR